MPHVDLKLRRGPQARASAEMRAWCAVLLAELNTLRAKLDLPLLSPQEIEAAAQAASRASASQKVET